MMNREEQYENQIKLPYSRRMIGRRVWVIDGGYYSDIVGVKDWQTFLVWGGDNKPRDVNIFDIRSTD